MYTMMIKDKNVKVNKKGFWKGLIYDKTKMSFIAIALTLAITTAILVGLVYTGKMPGIVGETWYKHIPAVAGATFTFITTMFAILRNGTKTREEKTIETLKELEKLHTKVIIINKQIKKIKKGKDNG